MTIQERQSQTERTEKMRERLCRAALEVIAKFGYEQSTTTMIAKHAGVSRGAQTHHFPTKFDLVVACFKFLLEEWEEKRAKEFQAHDGDVTAEHYIRFLWREIFGHPQYVAALELMLAVRGDENLKNSLAEALKEMTVLRQSMWHQIFADTRGNPERDLYMQMTICLLRGMSLQGSLEEAAPFETELLEKWIEIIHEKTGA